MGYIEVTSYNPLILNFYQHFQRDIQVGGGNIVISTYISYNLKQHYSPENQQWNLRFSLRNEKEKHLNQGGFFEDYLPFLFGFRPFLQGLFYVSFRECTPLKINMEQDHGGSEDHFPFFTFLSFYGWFVGSMLIFQGV